MPKTLAGFLEVPQETLFLPIKSFAKHKKNTIYPFWPNALQSLLKVSNHYATRSCCHLLCSLVPLYKKIHLQVNIHIPCLLTFFSFSSLSLQFFSAASLSVLYFLSLSLSLPSPSPSLLKSPWPLY